MLLVMLVFCWAPLIGASSAAEAASAGRAAAVRGIGFWIAPAPQYVAQPGPPIIAPMEVSAQHVVARPVQTFRWGYFGARAVPQCSYFRGYYGDRCDWILRRGY